MSTPELRCLQCDLILADSDTPAADKEACRECGRAILCGQANTAEEPLELDAIPTARLVQPAGNVNPTIPPSLRQTELSKFPTQMPRLREDKLPAETKPKIATALAVMGCMTILGMICVIVIAYAVILGLKNAKRFGQGEATPTSLVARAAR